MLEGSLVVRLLQPWHANIAKREVKSPKVFIRDAGLLHTLLDIETETQLQGHPRVGASWEGFAISEIARQLNARPEQCFFWAVHSGAGLDLLVARGNERRGFEIKLSDAPTVTASARTAMKDLKLDSLDIVHAGKDTYPLAERVRALSLSRLLVDLR